MTISCKVVEFKKSFFIFRREVKIALASFQEYVKIAIIFSFVSTALLINQNDRKLWRAVCGTVTRPHIILVKLLA